MANCAIRCRVDMCQYVNTTIDNIYLIRQTRADTAALCASFVYIYPVYTFSCTYMAIYKTNYTSRVSLFRCRGYIDIAPFVARYNSSLFISRGKPRLYTRRSIELAASRWKKVR